MEMVDVAKRPTSAASGRGSAAAFEESVLTTSSRTVSEVALKDLDAASLGQPAVVPENLASLHSDSQTELVKKTTVIDDEDHLHGASSVHSLKEYHKHQSRERKQRLNRNKVAPSKTYDTERPTTAPVNNNRQWLKEIDANRPMTAAAGLIVTTKQIPKALHPEASMSSISGISETTVKHAEEEKTSAVDVPVEEPPQPVINETAYIPYEYAQAMIARIVNDMNKMKSSHLSIITRMDHQYQEMETQSQEQFNECVAQLQERQKKRLQHYRHVIEILHAELKSKGALRAEAIQGLRERNKELALERKKMQRELSKSTFKIVPAHVDNREAYSPSLVSKPEEEEAAEENRDVEHKIIEDTKETEKVAEVAAQGALVGVVTEDGPREAIEEDEHPDVEEQVEIEEKKVEDEVVEEEPSDHEVEDEVVVKEIDVSAGTVALATAIVSEATETSVEKEKGQAKAPSRGDSVKKPERAQTTPEKKKQKTAAKSVTHPPADAMTSAEQAQQNKQQLILANKQTKKIKELEKQLEMERRKLEQSRKSAKNVDGELDATKTELNSLKKTVTEQKAELLKLEETAGAGTIALQKVPELQDEIKTLTTENQTLFNNYNSERVLRKKYYNMVEDMKGKIRVYCRVRPLSSTEKANKNSCAVSVPDEYTVKVEMNRGGMKEFQFDQIFSDTSSQENVFEDTNSLIQSAIDGYNVCIFAYGQTGSGKTYTMIGNSDQTQPGIAPRAFNRIFDIVTKNKKKFTFKVSCYMLELYNEKLVDLLGVGKNDNAKLDIKKDNKGMVVIQGTEVLAAESSEQLFSIFMKGSTNRHTASTKMNDESSRSHLVVGVVIESTNLTSGAVTRGKLSLVDLAGSERAAKTGATAQQLKEANSINKSLSALGDVISALSSEQSFIPYRNNKLTMLMQDSLGGNAKTLMFVNISPADYNSDESAISLTYASRVKLIKNDATKNADSKEVARLKQVIAKLKAGESVDE